MLFIIAMIQTREIGVDANSGKKLEEKQTRYESGWLQIV